jgi:opacity protein-like surface antigen
MKRLLTAAMLAFATMKRLLTAAMLAFAPSAAFAQVGCYVEGSLASSITSSKMEGAASVTVATDGYTGGIGVGCDYKLNSKFLVGALGRYDIGKIDGKTFDTKISQDAVWTAAARVGFFINPSTIIYGLAGISGTKIDLTGVDKLSADGLILGAGLEIDLGSSVWLGAEYAHTDYGKFTVDADQLRPTSDTVRATLKSKF